MKETREIRKFFNEELPYFLKWTVLSLLIGALVGSVGAAFGIGIQKVTRLWQAYPWMLFFMPVSGCVIVWLYRVAHQQDNRGTDTVLEAISSKEGVPAVIAPLIFAATLLSHTVSASVGREGAALQLGGSLGGSLAKLFRLEERERKLATMCGMSAGFAALFGTPLTAGIFALEVVGVGVFYHAALFPCMFSAFLAAAISGKLGLAAEHYEIGMVPSFDASGAAIAVLFGIGCALVGIVLCVSLHKCTELYKRYIPNAYLRIVVGSGLFILLTLCFPERPYNGSGAALIEKIFEGESVPYVSFLLKILFTGVAMGAGFKGGEIVPTLCVGASFGYLLASLFGLPVGIWASVGMVSLFVSATNCPISAIFMAFELFGFSAMPYDVLAITVSFALSGYYGLYHSQKILCSKTRLQFIHETPEK